VIRHVSAACKADTVTSSEVKKDLELLAVFLVLSFNVTYTEITSGCRENGKVISWD